MSITRRAAIFGGALSVRAFAQKPAADQYPDAAPYIPSPMEIAEAMLKLANVRPGDVVYDLGSGDGRVVVMAAQKFGASAVGVEIDSDLVRDARQRAQKAGVSGKVRFIESDLFETDLRPASVVTLYLLPKTVDRLKPKLLAELKPGARIVSFSFPFTGWPPAKVEEVNTRRLYLWIVPQRSN
jgi:protein-L-isoaspartate O-methyltransferase